LIHAHNRNAATPTRVLSTTIHAVTAGANVVAGALELEASVTIFAEIDERV
jgi:hypothetical protein